MKTSYSFFKKPSLWTDLVFLLATTFLAGALIGILVTSALPKPNSSASPAQSQNTNSPTPTHSTPQLGLVILQTTPHSPATPPLPQLQAELEAAQTELAQYEEWLASTRQAIEEAIEMTREQKENFDFASERREALLPLVESGALDPLTASQIHSAYISARAALSHAKFLLSSVRRDFGSEATRKSRLEQLRARVQAAREKLQAASASPTPPNQLQPKAKIWIKKSAVEPKVGQGIQIQPLVHPLPPLEATIEAIAPFSVSKENYFFLDIKFTTETKVSLDTEFFPSLVVFLENFNP